MVLQVSYFCFTSAHVGSLTLVSLIPQGVSVLVGLALDVAEAEAETVTVLSLVTVVGATGMTKTVTPRVSVVGGCAVKVV